MNDFGTKILGAIDRAIGGTPKPTDPNPSATVICEIALPRVKSTLGEKFTRAKKLFAEIRRLQKVVNELTDVAAAQAFDKQFADHQREAAEGDLSGVTRGRSRQAWLDDYSARRDAANEAMRQRGGELAPLQIEIADVILATLHDEIAELENVEARQAARFGITYAASPTVNKLRSLADYLRNRGAITILAEKL
jgi:hypothetical protein